MPDETQRAERDGIAALVEGARLARDPQSPSIGDYPARQSAIRQFVSTATLMPAASLTERFIIRSVRIDNYSGQWLLLGAADFIAPFTTGFVVSVRGLGTATITPTAPPGVSQSIVVAGQSYIVQLFDHEQPQSFGNPIVGSPGAGKNGQSLTVTAPNPAPFTPLIPAAQSVTLSGGNFVLTTSAVVGARLPAFAIINAAGLVVFRNLAVVTVQASSVASFQLYNGAGGSINTGAGAPQPIYIPIGFVLGPGYALDIRDNGAIDPAGDAWTGAFAVA